jgi:hypothetical protein
MAESMDSFSFASGDDDDDERTPGGGKLETGSSTAKPFGDIPCTAIADGTPIVTTMTTTAADPVMPTVDAISGGGGGPGGGGVVVVRLVLVGAAGSVDVSIARTRSTVTDGSSTRGSACVRWTRRTGL